MFLKIILGEIESFPGFIPEGVLVLLPFWPEFDDSVVVNEWLSVVLLIFGLAAMIAAFRFGPKVNRIVD